MTPTDQSSIEVFIANFEISILTSCALFQPPPPSPYGQAPLPPPGYGIPPPPPRGQSNGGPPTTYPGYPPHQALPPPGATYPPRPSAPPDNGPSRTQPNIPVSFTLSSFCVDFVRVLNSFLR